MEIPTQLKSFGLVSPSRQTRRRLVVTSEGDPGTGKSDFALRTAPRPILHIDLDNNIEGIEERYADDDGVLIKRVKMPVMINKEHDLEQFKEIRSLVLKSIEIDAFRTISMDTGDALYELCRRGFLGVLGFGEAKQSDFDVVNANMRRFFRASKEQRVNFYMPHRRTDAYREIVMASGKKTGVKSGERKRQGWKDAEYEAQVHLIFEKEHKTKEELDLDPLCKFKCTIAKCTANTNVEGMELIGEEITWPLLGTTVFPHSKYKDWV